MLAEDPKSHLPDHLLRWLEAVQRRVTYELDLVLDDEARAVGPRRLRILQLVPPAGIRQQDLADRALVTKQAIAELIDTLEATDLVERTPDPRDGRAWLILRTAYGNQVCASLDTAMVQVEETLLSTVGGAAYRTFLDVLRTLGRDQI